MAPASWTRLLLASLLVLATTTAAQTEGLVTTEVEPAALTIDYGKYIARPNEEAPGQSFTVQVMGAIECIPGTSPPADVVVDAAGTTTSTGQTGDESITYFALEKQNFTIPWTADPAQAGRYTIDHEETIQVLVEGAPAFEIKAELEWLGQYVDTQPGAQCDPSGYGWTIAGEQHTVTLPAVTGTPDENGEGEGEKEDTSIPGPGALAALAVLAGAFVRRHRW